MLSAGLLQVGISLFPRLQSETLSRFTRGLAFYSCEMAISIPMGAMWCSRSNPWPSQTWCHLPNDPKKRNLKQKHSIKKKIFQWTPCGAQEVTVGPVSRAECHIPHKAFLTAEVFYAIFHFVRCSLPMKRSVDPFDCRYFLEGSVKAHSLVYSEKKQ